MLDKWLSWLSRRLDKLVLLTIAGIAFVASAFTLLITLLIPILGVSTEWLNLSHYVQERIPAGILILLSTYVFTFLTGYERHVENMSSTVNDYKDVVEQARAGIAEHLRRWDKLGITEIYRSREDPGQKEVYMKLLQMANTDLLIVGVTLKDIIGEQRTTFIEKASNGCKIRLLLLTPKRWRNVEPVLDPIEAADLKQHFITSFQNIRRLALAIAKKPPEKTRSRRGTRPPINVSAYAFEVRFYDQAPTLSLSVADAGLDSGRMRVEFTPHNETDKKGFTSFRPMMDLVPKNDGLFSQFYSHYNSLWEASPVYLGVTGTKIHRLSQMDDFLSKELGLKENWVQKELIGADLTNP